MSYKEEHPQDLLLFLDWNEADERYEEVRQHVESCVHCSEEVKIWRSLDDMFRSPDQEIDVPPFQWQRIQFALEDSKPQQSKWDWIYGILKPNRLAMKLVYATLTVCLVALSGWEYHRIHQNQ